MTRMHFEAAARIVREYANHPGNSWAAMAIRDAYIELFTRFNPRFDAGRFIDACGPMPRQEDEAS
jgi:hypothetical protein